MLNIHTCYDNAIVSVPMNFDSYSCVVELEGEQAVLRLTSSILLDSRSLVWRWNSALSRRTAAAKGCCRHWALSRITQWGFPVVMLVTGIGAHPTCALRQSSIKRKRRTAVKDVDEDRKTVLRNALLRERDVYLEEHPSYRMLDSCFVCPACLIDKLCSEARFFSSAEDLNIVGLWPKWRLGFFNVISDVLYDAPSRKRSHRV